MSTIITLIQVEEVVNQGIVKAASLGNRFDASLIAPNIPQAELRFLKTSTSPSSSGFINPEFFDDLVAQKNPDPSNYNEDLGPIVLAYPSNADYELLWTQWLFPFLSKASYYESLDNIVIQVGSIGAQISSTQFGESVGISGLKHMKDTTMQDLTGNKPHIVNFLCANKDKYPLWDDTGYCSDCDNSKSSHGRTAGFVFKSKKNKWKH